ncbi:lipoprotein [Burkholderia thailandensis]|uniref:lipoprotein n=1 Tax=Burkholderia thailandensis TaxID=57975 RepID=UPI0005B71746|nr:lipoprotein [Burkholderia thailandensis]AVR10456.1 hypothetical protein A8H31_24795 [Burkholderia thailandensis]KIS56104.1 hypothetical protein BTP_2568 [Burkholderia thailandensis Phuket 4W-1]MCS3395860.1 hypothetical protein [Burkholderia thailandensis]MCS6511436.1 hypothetical protein [Burkholderia thailandensis]NBD03210.1 hypothetical protein [Burkholderia thailandensis]
MSSRRKFLLSTSAAATLPLVGAVVTACNDSIAEPAIGDAELARQMVGKLTAELNDAPSAAAIAPYLMDIGFTWDLPTIAAARIDRIVAYGFGNRANAASGNTPTNGANQTALPDPGPVNEALANAVYRIRRLKPVKVYAQWEIARFLASKYQMADVRSIEPVVAADGSVTYLSTDGVAAAIIALEGSAAAMGNVAVVGHRDHAKRCIQTSRARGMKAAAVAEVPLPTLYDPQSGQAWTRRRDLYLVHDMYAQLATLRANLIATAYPNG